MSEPGSDRLFEECLLRLRDICLSLPEVTERPSHGMPTFFLRDKRSFVSLENNHHGDGILGLWCAAPEGSQAALRAESPPWFFVPPYVGCRGWIGIDLRKSIDWEQVAELIVEGYLSVAPARLARLVSR